MRIMSSLVIRVGFFLAVFILFTPQISTSQSFGGVGERAEGMAGAFVAVADDASAVYWNPAGLGWPVGSIFDAQFGVAEDTAFVAVALPPLGVSFYRLPTVSSSADRQNEGSGKVPIRSLATTNVGATINQTIVNRLVIGSTFRLVRGGFEDQPGQTTFDIDAGAMYSAGDFRMAMTARNLRKPTFENESGAFSVDRLVRVGVAFAPRSLPTGVHGPFTVAFDTDLTKSHDLGAEGRDASLGGEYWLASGRVGMRGGVRWSTLNDRNRRFSGGLTVQFPHSLFVEGHLTKNEATAESDWGLGARFTF
jgi:hypothetical protein